MKITKTVRTRPATMAATFLVRPTSSKSEIIVVFILWIFFNTELGFSLRATGDNKNMIRAQGVNTDNTLIFGIMLGNGLIAVSSSLVAQFNGFADISMGTGTIVIGLASVIIGEVVFGHRNLFQKTYVYFQV